MAMPEAKDETIPVTRWSVVEIAVGYALILGIVAGLFGFAGGIDIEMPWPEMAGIALLGVALTLAAWRRCRR